MFVTLNVSPRNFIRTIKHQTWILEILPQAGDFDRVRQMVEERPELVSLASGEGWSLESWMFQVLHPRKTDMEPKNKGLEDDVPFQRGDFQVPCLFCWGYHFCKCSPWRSCQLFDTWIADCLCS